MLLSVDQNKAKKERKRRVGKEDRIILKAYSIFHSFVLFLFTNCIVSAFFRFLFWLMPILLLSFMIFICNC